MSPNSTIATTLQTVLKSDCIQSWEDLEPLWQHQIQQAIAPKSALPYVIYPNTIEELAEVVTCAHHNHWKVLPCGQASKLGWGDFAQGIDFVLSTARLNQVIDHAVGDLTVTAEAGVTFKDLQIQLARHHQFLALDPARAELATLGGIIASGDSGSLRHRYGGVRDGVLGIEFVRSDGRVARAGGRVVKNVAGYDLMKLLTGSYGTLGILTQVTFRLYPVPDTFATVILVGEAAGIYQATQTLLNSALTPIALDLLSSAIVQQLDLGLGLGLAVRFGSVAAGVQEQVKRVQGIAEDFKLQHQVLQSDVESGFWQQLTQILQRDSLQCDSLQCEDLQVDSLQREADRTKSNVNAGIVSILCKIGVPFTAAISMLQELDKPEFQQSGFGIIRAGSGLGFLRFPAKVMRSVMLEKLRSYCQTQGGFLTILEAPIALKEKLDVWGYRGNALPIMQELKQRLDPQKMFSPARFVGKI